MSAKAVASDARAASSGARGTPARSTRGCAAGPSWASAARTMPSHMIGATSGRASTLAGRPASETVPKWWAISGRGGNRGRQGDRDALGQGPRQRGERPAQQRGQREDPGDRGERELPPGVAARARVHAQRHARRQQQRVPARGRAGGGKRDQRRRAHDARPLQRRPRTRQRHVQRDQRHGPGQPGPVPDPRRGHQRQRERGQQHHVLPADGQDVREPGGAELVARGLVDELVLAQHHAAGQRRGRGRQPVRDPALGALACPVDHAGRPAAAPAGGRERVDGQLRCDAAAAVPGPDVEPVPRPLRRGPDEAGEAHLGPGPRPRGEPAAALQPQHQAGAAARAAGHACLDARPERPRARKREQVSAGMDRIAGPEAAARAVDGRQPEVAAERACQHQPAGQERGPRRTEAGEDEERSPTVRAASAGRAPATRRPVARPASATCRRWPSRNRPAACARALTASGPS